MEYRVSEAEAGSRLDVFISKQLANMGRRHVRQFISEGKVKVNNRIISKPGFLLFCDSLVEIDDQIIQEPLARPPVGMDQTLEVLYEDEYLLILNKTRAMHSVRLRHEASLSLADIVAANYPACINVSSDPREAGLAQRLDFYTSGALIAAKTSAVWQKIHYMLQCEEIKKTYFALCEGVISNSVQAIEEPILQQRSAKKVKITAAGVPALTNLRQSKSLNLRNRRLSLVEVEANRARRHQIRAHLAYIGHPLVGDTLYGASSNLASLAITQTGFPQEGFYLHAYKIAFNHPIDNEKISVVAKDCTLEFLKQEARWGN